MCVLSQILHISMRSCADFENENLLNLHKVSANLPWVPPGKHNYPPPGKIIWIRACIRLCCILGCRKCITPRGKGVVKMLVSCFVSNRTKLYLCIYNFKV